MPITEKRICIIGASGLGREVVDTIIEINKHSDNISDNFQIEGFYDDDESIHGTTINGIEVKGPIDDLKKDDYAQGIRYAVIAIADPKIKKSIAEKLKNYVTWVNVIHPTATISDFSKIGEGVILQNHVCIGPNAEVGNHCMINRTTNLGHDVVMSDYASIMSYCDITGHVKIGECAYVATSVAIIPGVAVEENAYIGAGSVVFKDVEKDTMVLGNPARRMK